MIEELENTYSYYQLLNTHLENSKLTDGEYIQLVRINKLLKDLDKDILWRLKNEN